MPIAVLCRPGVRATRGIVVRFRRGENRGQKVPQGNVVRELVRLGSWRGRPAVYRLPKATSPDLKTVVLVQSDRTGTMVAAGRR